MFTRARRLRSWLGLIGLGAVAFVLVFHPSRPLYMRHKPIDFVSTDGTLLAATLSLPRWAAGPVPAVVIVHGSGPLSRTSALGDVRRLVWEGFAVLAYDKRGVGASQGVYPRGWGADAELVLRLLAADAAAALDRTRREPDVDSSRVGFFGASQAGWIIPLASARLQPPPRFHVVISGPAVSTGVEERAIDGLRRAGNGSHTVIVYPDANHGLRSVTTGNSAPLWTDTLAWLQRIGVLESDG